MDVDQYKVPSQGSGLSAAAKSSIENFTSLPFFMRDSGSAFINQNERSVSMLTAGGAAVGGVGESDSDAASGSAFPFARGVLRGLPRPSFFLVTGVVGLAPPKSRIESAYTVYSTSAEFIYLHLCVDVHDHPSSFPGGSRLRVRLKVYPDQRRYPV